jgi:formate dehydrogenase subunit gamma
MNSKMIPRHTRINIFMHWFNAISWLFLFATGLGLIRNDHLEILGGHWAALLRLIFSGGENLLLAHEIVGVVWAAGFLLYGIINFKKYVVPFFREMISVDPRRDLLWLVKKGIQMTMGSRVMVKLGFDPKIPDQGFYNIGQKMFAVPSVLGGMLIAVTGFIMLGAGHVVENTLLVQWAIVIHFFTVMMVFAGLLIHVYMASIAAGERPAFISMFTGTVPEDYAKHHHRFWYDEVKTTEPMK